MKSLVKLLLIVSFLISMGTAQSQAVDEYIKTAEQANNSGDFKQAITIMKQAVDNNPENALANSYLGLYTGMSAGRTSNYMEAGKLVTVSFELLNKAVSLDVKNPLIRLHRGIMGISIPEFLGKLDLGIKDLQFITELAEQSPADVPKDILTSAYDHLGRGFKKKKNNDQAKAAWQKLIELSPNSELAKNAEKNIEQISELKKPEPTKKKAPDTADVAELKKKVNKDPNNPKLLIELGNAYARAKNFEQAEKFLKKAIEQDSTGVEAYKSLALVLGEMAEKGYDEKIYEDTDYRSKLAFEVMRVLDKVVELAPEDWEMRLTRGIIGVEMPFFVGKINQAMEDLNLIINSAAPNSIKAQALVWQGRAYQKKALTNWIKVVSEYSNSEATQSAFSMMCPPVKHLDLSKYKTPFLVIDFVLGFKDELAPQTAIWIETKDGKFVKTIYVSGFSGYAKEKQVNLSDWADASKFSDVDAVTAASIDLGHHIYIWDLKDKSGKKVQAGEYVVKVEVAYWPSMEYQSVSANIKLENKPGKSVVEEGNLIPYLEVEYYSVKQE